LQFVDQNRVDNLPDVQRHRAKVILDLRVILLSGTLDDVYRHTLTTSNHNQLRTPDAQHETLKQLAA
jgi:hypothetical protein